MNEPGVILGLSTAGSVEVALATADHDIALASNRGALESLAALLDRALREARRSLGDISLIGVCSGPGSFTGLRIGIAFAKSLAQVRGIPIIGISSYDVVAFGIRSFPIVSVVRGKRDYYYARLMATSESAPQFIQGSRDVIERAAAELGAGGVPAQIAGRDFSSGDPGDEARAVAQLARQAWGRGANAEWTNISIDYGQRPNAVVQRKKRHPPAEEEPPL